MRTTRRHRRSTCENCQPISDNIQRKPLRIVHHVAPVIVLSRRLTQFVLGISSARSHNLITYIYDIEERMHYCCKERERRNIFLFVQRMEKLIFYANVNVYIYTCLQAGPQTGMFRHKTLRVDDDLFARNRKSREQKHRATRCDG